MKIFFGIRAITTPPKSPVVTIGTYDGVHKGHQSILALVRERAGAMGGTPLVFTFDPHPAQVLFPKQPKPLLTTLQRRLKLFSYHGIEGCLIEKFDALLARTSAEEFVDQYIVSLRPAEVIVGYNFTFGAGAKGDVHFLRKRLIAQGIRLTAIDPVEIGGAPCSSSRIRALLSEGNLPEAHRLLGRYHSVTGKV
ncbi:MAG: FAD synthetase family protein, partial [Deltaproteobacteria bacterium]|nr:FAD synthetase family protein [Deltaproteobacteria bacterium]